MSDLPPDAPADTQPIPEFKREPDGGLPWLGILVIFLLLVAGAGLITFAFVYGQGETEDRAINGTITAIAAYTSTPAPTRAATSTPVPTVTRPPTETPTVPPTETPTTGPTFTLTFAPTATNTRPAQPIIVPTATPAPPTATPIPVSKHGITGELLLCNPEKPSFAANIERICFREKIVNTTGQPISYGVLGVQIADTATGSSRFHSSWQGALSIGPGCTGPTDSCGGPWEDGIYIATPGTYRLTLSVCFSEINTCLGGSGDWETLTSGVNVTVVNWTP